MTADGTGPLSRVVGIETEYAVTLSGPGRSSLSLEDAVTELMRPVARARSGTHRFTSAGARLYVDVGLHPEYAGAECLNARDLVAQDRAGDEILAELARSASTRLADRGVRLHVLKTNTDTWGATFGCHENYQVARDVALPVEGLVGVLAARQVLAGAGALVPRDADGRRAQLGRMLYSSRADHIHYSTSADPTHSRAFINTRDEPHADADRWRRLHVVAGDSAISPWTTALKAVLVDALLVLVERGQWDLDECRLSDPAAAASAWAADPGLRAERASGRAPVSCPDLLETVLERITPVIEERADALSLAVLDLARRGTRALREADPTGVEHELDWAVKHRLLSRVATRYEEGWQDVRVTRTALAYHDLSAVTGLRAGLEERGLIRPLLAPAEAARARSTPPADTRAVLRGRVVAACERTGRKASIGWSHVRLDDPPSPQIDLPDPQSERSGAVDRLVARIEELGQAPRPPW